MFYLLKFQYSSDLSRIILQVNDRDQCCISNRDDGWARYAVIDISNWKFPTQIFDRQLSVCMSILGYSRARPRKRVKSISVSLLRPNLSVVAPMYATSTVVSHLWLNSFCVATQRRLSDAATKRNKLLDLLTIPT